MGGVASALGKVAIEGLEKIPTEAIAKESGLLFRSLEHGMRSNSAAGNDMADLLHVYTQKLGAAKESLAKQHMALPKAQQLPPEALENMAKNQVRAQVLGRNDYRGVGLIKAVENEPGLTPIQIHMKQQELADHVHMFLKDTKTTEMTPNDKVSRLSKWRQKDIAAKTNIGPQSQFKLNVKNAKENAVAIDTGAKYSPAGPTEKFFRNWANNIMLPAIAIPHIGTLFNYANNIPLQDLVKGTAEATFNNSSVRQQAADYGIFGSTIMDAYTVRYNGARGIIAKATGKDSLGVAVSLLMHQPGFNALREYTISIGAAAGKHTAERMADRLIQSKGKDTVAQYELRRLGLTPADVMAKGSIDPDMMKKAVWSAVDRNVFLDSTMQRSFRANQNTFYRMAGMYHGYVSRQGKMITDAVYHNIIKHEGGALKAAQTLATLGIVFPTVGVGLKSMQMWGRGQFNTHMLEDEKELYGAKGMKPAMKMWLEGQSHMAAFGVMTDYIRGATRSQLINSAAGPLLNEGANIAQDTVSMGKNIYEGKDLHWKPLARDAMKDTIPLHGGHFLSHYLLPTAKEEREAHPSHKLKKLGSKSKFKKLKKLN